MAEGGGAGAANRNENVNARLAELLPPGNAAYYNVPNVPPALAPAASLEGNAQEPPAALNVERLHALLSAQERGPGVCARESSALPTLRLYKAFTTEEEAEAAISAIHVVLSTFSDANQCNSVRVHPLGDNLLELELRSPERGAFAAVTAAAGAAGWFTPAKERGVKFVNTRAERVIPHPLDYYVPPPTTGNLKKDQARRNAEWRRVTILAEAALHTNTVGPHGPNTMRELASGQAPRVGAFTAASPGYLATKAMRLRQWGAMNTPTTRAAAAEAVAGMVMPGLKTAFKTQPVAELLGVAHSMLHSPLSPANISAGRTEGSRVARTRAYVERALAEIVRREQVAAYADRFMEVLMKYADIEKVAAVLADWDATEPGAGAKGAGKRGGARRRTCRRRRSSRRRSRRHR